MNNKSRPPRALRTILCLCLALGNLLQGPSVQAADPVAQLIRVLGSAGSYKQRLAAIIGLGRRKDPRAVPALIKALDDSEHTVRGAAAKVLGQLGDARARVALEALLVRAKHEFVRQQAQQALSALLARLGDGAKAPGGSRMQVQGIMGVLDQQQVQDGINAALPMASECFNQQFQTAPYLGGQIVLKFRVTADGKVKWIRIRRSDLGSIEAEQCITTRMMGATFDAPDGGEAEFSMPLTFGGGAPVTKLDPATSAIPALLKESCKELLKGEGRKRLKPPPGLWITMYITPHGTVAAAGLSAGGEEIPAEFAQAFVTNLKQLTLKEPSLLGGYGKLMLALDCSRKRRGRKRRRRRRR